MIRALLDDRRRYKGKLPDYDDAARFESAVSVVRKKYAGTAYDTAADIAPDETVKTTCRGYLKCLDIDFALVDDGTSNRSSVRRMEVVQQESISVPHLEISRGHRCARHARDRSAAADA